MAAGHGKYQGRAALIVKGDNQSTFWPSLARNVFMLCYGLEATIRHSGQTNMAIATSQQFAAAWSSAIIVVAAAGVVATIRSRRGHSVLLEQATTIATVSLLIGNVIAVIVNAIQGTGVQPGTLGIWMPLIVIGSAIWRGRFLERVKGAGR